jgi:hypothetical protein
MKNIYRHGDVDIIEIDTIPPGLKKQDNLTVAYGEATGHHHTIVVDRPNLCFVYVDDKGNKWIEAQADVVITHQEHKTLKIKKGFYQVKIEREFNPFDEVINQVRD